MSVFRLMGGVEAEELAKLLLARPGMREDEIAAELQIDVKRVRKLLHQLSEFSLVAYDIVIDKELNKRVFRWRLQQEQVQGVVKTQLKRIAERLQMLKRHYESNQLYWCGSQGCRKYTFDEALDKFFKCPTCGGKLMVYDPSELIAVVDEKLAEINKLLE
ncbi:MAG: hypothetical protein RMJ28_07385 [Nitrososphaerota archaeon]|nr:hypothetical protein [Nitrososphaerota archaeon]